MNSSSPPIEKSPCIFCNIANKIEDTEILYEDEDICVFRDIKPASDYHILIIPKKHIEDAKCLTPADKNLVDRMLSTAKDLLSKNNLSLEDARFGYHWPPCRSVKHLHLHAIAPESKMGIISKMIFMKNSYWFVSATHAGCSIDMVGILPENVYNLLYNLWAAYSPCSTRCSVCFKNNPETRETFT